MADLIVLMGVPGAGKSTWTKMRPWQIDIVSPDDIRASLGDINDQSRNDEVFDRAYYSVSDRLSAYRSVVFDATNVRADTRERLIEIANRYNARKRLVVFTNIDAAWQRNTNRTERVVPLNVMARMTRNFTQSLSQVCFEDWDIIEFVRD